MSIYPVPSPRQPPAKRPTVEFERSGILARTFDGVAADGVVAPIGGANLTGAYTLAALVRRGANGLVAYYVSNITSAAANATTLAINTSNQLAVIHGFTLRTSTTTITAADGWVLIAVTKAAGTTTPRAHIFKLGAWTHENMSSTLANPASQAAGTINLGSNSVLGSTDTTHLAVAGEWASELSDANVEALNTTTATQDWANLSPVALWDFNQASIGTAVQDLIGAADQTSISGTTVYDDGPAGWDYGVAISRTLVPATEADAAQALSVTKPIYKTLTPATETSAAQALDADKSKSLTAAVETDTAQTISFTQGGPIYKTLTPATETDTGQALTFTKPIYKTLTAALETATAVALLVTKTIYKSLGSGSETDTAQALSYGIAGGPQFFNITPATETDTSRPLAYAKPIVKALVAATEADAAQSIGHYKSKLLVVAAEVDTAQPLSITHPIRVTITPATETDIAQLLDLEGQQWTYGPHDGWTYGPYPGYVYNGGGTATYGAAEDWNYGGTAPLTFTYGG